MGDPKNGERPGTGNWVCITTGVEEKEEVHKRWTGSREPKLMRRGVCDEVKH